MLKRAESGAVFERFTRDADVLAFLKAVRLQSGEIGAALDAVRVATPATVKRAIEVLNAAAKDKRALKDVKPTKRQVTPTNAKEALNELAAALRELLRP